MIPHHMYDVGEVGSKKYLTASLDQSLKRLGVDYVETLHATSLHASGDSETEITL